MSNKNKSNFRGAPSGIPDVQTTTLRHSITKVLNGNATGSIVHGYVKASDIYNPEDSSSPFAGQPMAYDTWRTLYNHYVVLGAKLTVKFLPESGIAPTVCGSFLTADAPLPYGDYNNCIESRMGSVAYISGNQHEPQTTVSKYSAKKFFRVTDVNDNIDRLGAPIDDSPSENAFFQVWAQVADKATDNGSIYAIVTIDYVVQFSEPKSLPPS